MNRVRVIAMICVSVVFSGCATVPLESQEASDEAKTFAPPPAGKSGLYIYRGGALGGVLKKDVWLNEDCVGETAPNVFFHDDVQSDTEHKISAESAFGKNDLLVAADRGKNYFIQQSIKLGGGLGGANLKLVDEEKGKKDVSKLKLAVKGNCGKPYDKAGVVKSYSRGISYNYVQLGYESRMDTGSFQGPDAQALTLSGSANVSEGVAIYGYFGALSFDKFRGEEVDQTWTRIGSTIYSSLFTNTDVYGEISFVGITEDESGGLVNTSISDTGGEFSIGLRHMLLPNVELGAKASRLDIFSVRINTILLEGRYFVDDRISVGAAYQSTNLDFENILLNLRYDLW